jgi:hypothetical protein
VSLCVFDSRRTQIQSDQDSSCSVVDRQIRTVVDEDCVTKREQESLFLISNTRLLAGLLGELEAQLQRLWICSKPKRKVRKRISKPKQAHQGAASSVPTSTVALAKSVVQQDGVTGLWRGMSTTVSRAVIIGSVKLACYDEVKLALKAVGFAPGSGEQIIAAAIATGLLVSLSSVCKN